MRSLESRAAALAKALDQAAAEETTVGVDMVCVESRPEALALLSLPPTPPPNVARVRLTTKHYTAAEYLGGTLPEPPPST